MWDEDQPICNWEAVLAWVALLALIVVFAVQGARDGAAKREAAEEISCHD